MKAKDGFALRTIVDEYILMPTGTNIDKFDGTVVLNEVSAFLWEKLQRPTTQEELLRALLDEYEVSRERAEKDLEGLLQTFVQLGLLEL